MKRLLRLFSKGSDVMKEAFLKANGKQHCVRGLGYGVTSGRWVRGCLNNASLCDDNWGWGRGKGGSGLYAQLKKIKLKCIMHSLI